MSISLQTEKFSATSTAAYVHVITSHYFENNSELHASRLQQQRQKNRKKGLNVVFFGHFIRPRAKRLSEVAIGLSLIQIRLRLILPVVSTGNRSISDCYTPVIQQFHSKVYFPEHLSQTIPQVPYDLV